jgi:hypothetical protein
MARVKIEVDDEVVDALFSEKETSASPSVA